MNNFEKNLKLKMDSLVSEVDCFDKIIRKSFVSEKNAFLDNDCVESNVENITGKRQIKIAPIIAILTTACVLAFTIIPNRYRDNLLAGIKNSENICIESYHKLKEELDFELENFNYTFIDYESIYDYNLNSGCHNILSYYNFTDIPNIDEKIRVYTKTYTNPIYSFPHKILTNQMYIVKYKDEFSDENIISITDSSAKFDSEEIWGAYIDASVNITFDDFRTDDTSKSTFLNNPFSNYSPSFNVTDKYLYKIDDEIYTIYSDVLFYFDENNEDIKNYSYIAYYSDGVFNKYIDFDFTNVSWNSTMYQYEEINALTPTPTFINKNIMPEIFAENNINPNDSFTQNSYEATTPPVITENFNIQSDDAFQIGLVYNSLYGNINGDNISIIDVNISKPDANTYQQNYVYTFDESSNILSVEVYDLNFNFTIDNINTLLEGIENIELNGYDSVKHIDEASYFEGEYYYGIDYNYDDEQANLDTIRTNIQNIEHELKILEEEHNKLESMEEKEYELFIAQVKIELERLKLEEQELQANIYNNYNAGDVPLH